jgi:acetyl-CoA carboxylase alpha subunit
MNSLNQVVEPSADISHRLIDASNTIVDLSFSAILPDDISVRACSIETVELSVNLLEQTSVLENIISEELNNKHEKIVETIVETIDEQVEQLENQK